MKKIWGLVAVLSFFVFFSEAKADEVSGKFETVFFDREDGKCEAKYFIDTGQSRIEVDFGEAKITAGHGDEVRALGHRVGDKFVCQNITPAINKPMAAPPLSLREPYTERLITIVCAPFDMDPNTYAYGVSEVTDVLYNAELSVKKLWGKASRGIITLEGDTVGPVVLDGTIEEYYVSLDRDAIAMAQDAMAKVDEYVDFTKYDRLVLVFIPSEDRQVRLPGSFASLGKGVFNTNDGDANLSVAWMGSIYVRSIAHELGHNFGLEHSGGSWLPTTKDGKGCAHCDYSYPFVGSYDVSCMVYEYGDICLMGGGDGYPSWLKRTEIGLLKEEEVVNVNSDCTLWLDNTNDTDPNFGGGPKIAKIPLGFSEEGMEVFTAVEYFQKSDFDYSDWRSGNVLMVRFCPWERIPKFVSSVLFQGDGYKGISYFLNHKKYCDPVNGYSIQLLKEEERDGQMKAQVRIKFYAQKVKVRIWIDYGDGSGWQEIENGALITQSNPNGARVRLKVLITDAISRKPVRAKVGVQLTYSTGKGDQFFLGKTGIAGRRVFVPTLGWGDYRISVVISKIL